MVVVLSIFCFWIDVSFINWVNPSLWRERFQSRGKWWVILLFIHREQRMNTFYIFSQSYSRVFTKFISLCWLVSCYNNKQILIKTLDHKSRLRDYEMSAICLLRLIPFRISCQYNHKVFVQDKTVCLRHFFLLFISNPFFLSKLLIFKNSIDYN